MEKLNQMEAAKRGIVTDEMIAVAKFERRDGEWIRERVANGRIVVPANKLHTSLKPMGIGRELKTKINANIGTSPTSSCIAQELTKLDAAISYGADTVMDLPRATIWIRRAVPSSRIPSFPSGPCRSTNWPAVAAATTLSTSQRNPFCPSSATRRSRASIT